MRLEADPLLQGATVCNLVYYASQSIRISLHGLKASMFTRIGASDVPLLMGTTQAIAPSARRQRSSSLLNSMLKSVSVKS